MVWYYRLLFILIMITVTQGYKKRDRQRGGYYGHLFRKSTMTLDPVLTPIYIHSWVFPRTGSFNSYPMFGYKETYLPWLDTSMSFTHHTPVTPVHSWYHPYTHRYHSEFKNRDFDNLLYPLYTKETFDDPIYSYNKHYINQVTQIRHRPSWGEETGYGKEGLPPREFMPSTHRPATSQFKATHSPYMSTSPASTDRQPVVVVINSNQNRTDTSNLPPGPTGVMDDTRHSSSGNTNPARLNLNTPVDLIQHTKKLNDIIPDFSDIESTLGETLQNKSRPYPDVTVHTRGVPISVDVFNSVVTRRLVGKEKLWFPIEAILTDGHGFEQLEDNFNSETNEGDVSKHITDNSDETNDIFVKSSITNNNSNIRGLMSTLTNTTNGVSSVSVINPFLEPMEKMGAFGPGPYYKCHPPSRVVCGANTHWYHVTGMEAWCQQNCVVDNYSSYCDDNRCLCRCVHD